jgi:glycosyltransferase involved in cell wall biosynthesis
MSTQPSEHQPIAKSPSRSMARVVIIQEQLKQYRLPLFSQLAAALAAEHIELTVLYSHPNLQEAQKADHRLVDAPWCQTIAIYHWRGLTWQCLPFSQLQNADLVIIEQANRHLANWCCWLAYRLKVMTKHRLRWPNLAFWGHGQDFQRPHLRYRDRVKQWLITTVHWWFAYTPQVAQAVAAQGMPSTKIVALTNTVDSRHLHAAVTKIRLSASQASRAQWQGDVASSMTSLCHQTVHATESQHGLPVFRWLFCGALYAHKRLDLLFAAADVLSAEGIPLQLTIIGAGPLQAWCEQMCAARTYASYVGALFADSGSDVPHDDGAQKDPRARYFADADVLVIPGLVGLAVVDGFAADLPLITTDVPYHSPEISYLRSGYNGMMCQPEANDLAATLRQLWLDPALLARLRQGAHDSYPQLQLPVMVAQFCKGIMAALAVGHTAPPISRVDKEL